jgi:hypothetical protein
MVYVFVVGRMVYLTHNPWHESRPEAVDFRRRIMGG